MTASGSAPGSRRTAIMVWTTPTVGWAFKNDCEKTMSGVGSSKADGDSVTPTSVAVNSGTAGGSPELKTTVRCQLGLIEGCHLELITDLRAEMIGEIGGKDAVDRELVGVPRGL